MGISAASAADVSNEELPTANYQRRMRDNVSRVPLLVYIGFAF